MRAYFRWSLPAVMMLGLTVPCQADAVKKPANNAVCGDYGTSVHFEKSPSDAARRALKEEKLVCVLHISGYFEDPDYT
ncbi:MAG: hypothetical protein NZO58_04700 [Gemmataceae bacterium]|nr:hypothetical protein [Gemmataceae bacterium]